MIYFFFLCLYCFHTFHKFPTEFLALLLIFCFCLWICFSLYLSCSENCSKNFEAVCNLSHIHIVSLSRSSHVFKRYQIQILKKFRGFVSTLKPQAPQLNLFYFIKSNIIYFSMKLNHFFVMFLLGCLCGPNIQSRLCNHTPYQLQE